MSPNRSRILLVEDDPDQAQLFSLILATDDREILLSPDAEAALAQLAESPVTLLLADWNLPGIKGDALIVAVKAQFPEVKTVLYSNHAHVNEAAAECGADAWFRKMDSAVHMRQVITGLLS